LGSKQGGIETSMFEAEGIRLREDFITETEYGRERKNL
jgi:hypothetical protein